MTPADTSADPVARTLREFTFLSRYARERSDGSRETWDDAVDRVREMHRRRYPALRVEIDEAFEAVRQRRVMPSMRSMQFGGAAQELNHARGYNCAAMAMCRPAAFAEYLYLLLCGAGVGISVQREHVWELPALRQPVTAAPHVVGDSIEGWADAVRALVDAYMAGAPLPEFDYSAVRPAGAPIVTGGGYAPGSEPLRIALNAASAVFNARADIGYLRPIDVYDICMFLSRAVLSGGIRRSATAVLFSPGDNDMLHAKTADWFATASQRAYSNNSVVLDRATATREDFAAVVAAARHYGEPGFYFTDDAYHDLTNPCYEISLRPFTDSGRPGVAFCNLTTINGGLIGSPADLYDAARIAAFIGTLQAGYTDFPYITPTAREIAERDALLGVSICGFLENPGVLLDPATLRRASHWVRVTNQLVADRIGIRSAARLTCVKPDGTVSLALGLDVAGIHPAHACRYLRRIRCAPNDPVFVAFAKANPHAVEQSVTDPNTWIATFPVEAPATATLRADIDALTFLRNVVTVQRAWVDEGTVRGASRHAVSNTCTVRDDEWPAVEQFIWDNRHELAAVSLLGYTGDKTYTQAPREALSAPEDADQWQTLRERWTVPAWDTLTGSADVAGEAACAGGLCEL